MDLNELKIDEEFRDLLPALDDKTLDSLELDITLNGVHTPIAIWNGYIIDGHNRYGICVKHDIEFETIDYTDKLVTRDDVILWIITTQISRRNLTPQQLSYYRGKQYQIEKKRVGERDKKDNPDFEMRQIGALSTSNNTARRLAVDYNVSPRTIQRDNALTRVIDTLGEIAPESRRMILAGKSPVRRQELEGLARKPRNELEPIAFGIADGTYTKPPDNEPLSEAGIMGVYARIIADIVALDGALKQVKDSLSERLRDIDDAMVNNDIKLRLRKQAEAFSALMRQLVDV